MYKSRTDYIQKVFALESEKLKAIRAATTDPNDQISIHPQEGKLLQFLIRLSGAKKIIEVGTLAGYSTQWMLEALPPDGHIFTLEMDPVRAVLAQKNLSSPQVTLVTGDARETLPALGAHAPFDMAFIDADKVGYLDYLDGVEKLVRKGGLIVGDNTFLFDSIWKDEPVDRVRNTALKAMRAFNERLADPQKYTGILLPTQEGMTVAVKNF